MQTNNPHTDIVSKSVSCYLVPVMGTCSDRWTLSGNHLLATSVLDHMSHLALHFSTSALEDSQYTRPVSHEMFQDCELLMLQVMPVILDQHTSFSPVRKNMQKIPYQTVGRSAREIGFYVIFVGRISLASKQSLE